MGRLSTHILDTVRGKPAADVAIDLDALQPDGSWRHVKQVRSNADGRTDQPVLAGDELTAGTYMLTFHMGAYFKAHGLAAEEPLFLDLIPLRFTVGDAAAHYHVPLLATPWSYQTYRGS
ncbi:hydroxyisourate hydrolase [Bradyrhizobium sp. HKCCYLS20291]|uniref:hydroxyisourate hydrolase n=1 Tax=Bradyrhizobium sp. HKCCYLS20291 TaxID=3420766 RepID=UPI003EC15620